MTDFKQQLSDLNKDRRQVRESLSIANNNLAVVVLDLEMKRADRLSALVIAANAVRQHQYSLDAIHAEIRAVESQELDNLTYRGT